MKVLNRPWKMVDFLLSEPNKVTIIKTSLEATPLKPVGLKYADHGRIDRSGNSYSLYMEDHVLLNYAKISPSFLPP